MVEFKYPIRMAERTFAIKSTRRLAKSLRVLLIGSLRHCTCDLAKYFIAAEGDAFDRAFLPILVSKVFKH